jgi:hypothetical protein
MKDEEKALCELKMQINEHRYKIDQAEECLTNLKASDAKQWSKLRNIKQSMMIVKWTVIGVALATAGKTIGLPTLLKLLGV